MKSIALVFACAVAVGCFALLVYGMFRDRSNLAIVRKHLESLQRSQGLVLTTSLITSRGTLALDLTNQQFYVGSAEPFSKLQDAVFPLSKLLKYERGEATGKIVNCYVDITVDVEERPNWRLYFGARRRLTADIVKALDGTRLDRAVAHPLPMV